MKYEEWIRYEEKRVAQSNPAAWVSLDPDIFRKAPWRRIRPLPEDKNRVWTLVVQVFNTRRI